MSWRLWLGRIVLGWTAFTTVFTWTVTNRGVWQSELSASSIGDEGVGRTASFGVAVFLAGVALLLFYLNGRRRVRWLTRALLVGWHVSLASLVLLAVAVTDGQATFVGATWGVSAPLGPLAFVIVGFGFLALAWAVLDASGPVPEPRAWNAVGWRRLAAVAALLPVVAVLFHFTEGYTWLTRAATAIAVVQWLLLISAVDDPGEPSTRAPTRGGGAGRTNAREGRPARPA